MNSLFRVGETALVVAAMRILPEMARYVGDTIIVEGPLRFIEGHSRPQYIVRSITDWSLFYAPQCCLQRLPPTSPSTDLLDAMTPRKVTRWSESPWRPAGVRA